MKNKNVVILVVFFCICFLLLGVSIANIFNEDSSEDNSINLPSQCYTNLQPSNNFPSSINGISPITINQEQKYFKFDLSSIEGNFSIIKISNTGSMRPALPDYAQVVVFKPSNKKDLKVGDIIIFECKSANKDSNIIHRIISIDNDIYLTKGDNNKIDDVQAFNCSTTFDKIVNKVAGVIY